MANYVTVRMVDDGSSGKEIGNTWVVVTGAAQQMEVNHGYIANGSSLVTLTLPSTAPAGSQLRIVGKGSGKWKIAQNAGEVIRTCITADNEWVISSHEGTFAWE